MDKYIVPRKSIDLINGEKVPFPFKQILDGEKTWCQIEHNSKNGRPVILTVIATRLVEPPDKENKLEMPIILDENPKIFNLFPRELLDQGDNRYEKITISANEDISIGFSISYDDNGGFMDMK